MQAILALAFELFNMSNRTLPIPKQIEADPKEEVIMLFEEYEKKRETKLPTMRARL